MAISAHVRVSACPTRRLLPRNRTGVGTALLTLIVVAASLSLHAQTPPYVFPACLALPDPAADTWPVAKTDALTATTASLQITAGTLLANDRGTSLRVTSVGPTSTKGGVVTGTGPYIFTVPPGFNGLDVLTYEISNEAGQTAIGLVKVNVVAVDTAAPSVSISTPAAAQIVAGTVLVTASATDNIGVAGVRVFDGTRQIGAEITRAPFRVSWNTAGLANGPHSLWAEARDAAGNTTKSASVSVTVSNVAVPSVLWQTQAAAQATLTSAGLSVGAITTASSTVPAGAVVSQSPAAGTLVLPNSPVGLVLSSGASAATEPAVLDRKVTVAGGGSRTTNRFSTSVAGEVLLAFVMADGPSTGAQTITVSGAGLAWRRVQRAGVRPGGVVEVWTATAPSRLVDVKVTSSLSLGSYEQSLVVLAYRGTGGVGASVATGGSSGVPTATLTTLGANSLVFAAGVNWNRAIARTLPAGQVKVNEVLDTGDGVTFWVQSAAAPIAAAGAAATLTSTAPAIDPWNFVMVELLGSAR